MELWEDALDDDSACMSERIQRLEIENRRLVKKINSLITKNKQLNLGVNNAIS